MQVLTDINNEHFSIAMFLSCLLISAVLRMRTTLITRKSKGKLHVSKASVRMIFSSVVKVHVISLDVVC